MAEKVTIDIDDLSNLESWQKEAIFKTLLMENGMSFKMADVMVTMYTNGKIYKENIPENVMNNMKIKFSEM